MSGMDEAGGRTRSASPATQAWLTTEGSWWGEDNRETTKDRNGILAGKSPGVLFNVFLEIKCVLFDLLDFT